MSWVHQQNNTDSNAPPPMYNPNQHSSVNNQWQAVESQNWYNPAAPAPNQQPEFWQPPQQQYATGGVANAQTRQPADYQRNTPSAGHFQYNQPSPQAFYQNVGQYDQQHAYDSFSYNPQYSQPNSFNAAPTQPQQQQQQQQQPQSEDPWNNWETWADEDNSNVSSSVSQQPLVGQAGNLGDSFINDQSWNWSLQDGEQPNSSQTQQPSSVQSVQNAYEQPSITPQQPLENKILKIRGKLDTPQWSTESQPSQESSDDVQHTSESDKSHMVSRSSTISQSPVSGQDFLPPPQIPKRGPGAINEVENKEIVLGSQQEVLPPPRPPVRATPPLTHPPPSSSAEGAAKNPYKRTTGLSHKAANTFRTSNITPPDSRQQPFIPPPNIPTSSQQQPVNLETLPDNSEHPDRSGAKMTPSPGIQPWIENNEVPINDRNQYLETGQLSQTNSLEGGGDILPPPGLQRMIPGQLEQERPATADNQDDPLPGFSRMVLGQTENPPPLTSQEPAAIFDPTGPPEGLHRMIPGESSSPETSMLQAQTNENDSEIELSQINLANFAAQQPRSATIGADTPPASTQTLQNSVISVLPSIPPNRSEAIGEDRNHDTSIQSNSGDNVHVRGASVSSGDGRNSKSSKSLKGKDKTKGEQQGSRREFIEGQTDDNTTVSGITNSIRNLTVGENPSDGQPSSGSLPEPTRSRRQSRVESSDSEADSKLPSKLPPRDTREKRSEKSKTDRDRHRDRDGDREKYREKESDRYSPDPYRRRDPRRSKRRDPQHDVEEDYYSDKEKDRRNKDDRDRDHERKYNSLRTKEKERKRRDRDGRDRDGRDVRDNREYRDSRRGADYHNRYGDDRGYPDENRTSRPSSRSDSMHESYREKPRRHEADHRRRRGREGEREHRDHYRSSRDSRDPFSSYQNYQYDPYNQYQQQYQQYYENLRRMNPQAYAEWYRKYYQQVAGGSNTSFTGEDRASVHSGRSSANEELAKDRYTRQNYYASQMSSLANYYGHSQSKTDLYGGLDSSINPVLNSTNSYVESTLTGQRLTPKKFTVPCMKGSITSGKLIQILPSYPIDGQLATIELINLQYLLEHDEQYIELSSFPGPLSKGMTHKKTIIEYCDNKIRKAAYNDSINDIDSYILMWELLILLIRQNGMVVGTDIAELLLKNCNTSESPTAARPPSVISNSSSVNQTSEASNPNLPGSQEMAGSRSSLKEEEVTKKFRDHLLYGSGKEALEWAMKHGLWGHALFLASKLDKRTYANVMMRFANGLAMNDPLQTLYQLLSGKMPAAVTCVSDEKWGDWRPHLAMILSNSTQRPELHRRAITILGDTLLNRGNLYAAQFCYLMAEVGFSKYDSPDTRLVLLGSDHRIPYPQFVTNEAIHMTEIYEYACSLNDQGFIISEFQIYKYILAARLADVGLVEKSLIYLEKLASYIVSSPQEVSPNFVDHVWNLADRLKFYDPVGDGEDESEFGGAMETNRPDNSWLKELKDVQLAFQAGQITQDTTDDYPDYNQPESMDPYQQQENLQQNNAWEPQQQQQYEQQYGESGMIPPLHLQQEQPQMPLEFQGMAASQPGDFSNSYHQEAQSMYTGESQEQYNQWGDNSGNPEGATANQFDPEGVNSFNDSPYHVNNNNIEKRQEVEKEPAKEDLSLLNKPQISMPNQQKTKSAYDDEPLPHEMPQKNTEKPKQNVQSPNKDLKQSTGWFGGIFSRLSMKPKNQMKLPDDKNPKIVWDQEKKRWINVDEDPSDPATEFKPPPKMADLMPKLISQPPPAMSVPGRLPQGIPQEAPIPTYNTATQFSNGSQIILQANGGGSAGPASLPTHPEEGASLPSGPPKPNMFKLKRGRNLKNSYVDVFNPGGGASATNSGPSSLLGVDKMAAPSQPAMNFFVPPPVNDPNAPVDFLTPAPPMQVGEQGQNS